MKTTTTTTPTHLIEAAIYGIFAAPVIYALCAALGFVPFL
tara:strand:+ start:509 stop:628 length:120 start_codon:yes stop_codon:yes gene_type:complete